MRSMACIINDVKDSAAILDKGVPWDGEISCWWGGWARDTETTRRTARATVPVFRVLISHPPYPAL